VKLDPEEFLDSTVGESAASQAALTSKKNYRHAYRFINLTSYSQREVLHRCPREFQLMKRITPGVSEEMPNIDFAFGHSAAAGVQTYIVTGDKQASLLAAFLAWNIDLETDLPKKNKSVYFAILAVLKFINYWDAVREHWEVATFNGRPASELLFWLDCENGHHHVGHIDIILRNKNTKKYTVLEIKTTSAKIVDEAMYGNSDQALGYSIILDTIAGLEGGVATFDVLYFVYSTVRREWETIPFQKSRTMRAEWLQDLLLDQTTINTYIKLKFFPKRGSSCWTFSRRCPHYGVCDFKEATRTDHFETWEPNMPLPEKPDFVFNLKDVLDTWVPNVVVRQ